MSGAQPSLFPAPAEDILGTISIRVHILPPKKTEKKGAASPTSEDTPRDADEAEDLLFDDRSETPLGSYLENSRGVRCVVFVVNGQRQEFLDNGFIVRELGFKYLRNRMMITVDVDGLVPEAIGELMQASRQGFYKGDVWNTLRKRIVATLKDDPDLLRLEQEAEAKVAELEGGDEKVKSALDKLIEAHHARGLSLAEGLGSSGAGHGHEMGNGEPNEGNVVSLFPPTTGLKAEPPVLVWRPSLSAVRLKPDEPRRIVLASEPANTWPALAQCDLSFEGSADELSCRLEKGNESGEVTLTFTEPDGFDPENYPLRAVLVATARFNGISEPRQARLNINVRPDKPAPPPVLLDEPDHLMITSRQPVKLWRGDSDTHVRFRWNGKDNLLGGRLATWRLTAHSTGEREPAKRLTFSEPFNGRFTLAISPHAQWQVGEMLTFEVRAIGPREQTLSAQFTGEVLDRPEPPLPDDSEEPRLIEGRFRAGETRRPPYVLKIVMRNDYHTQCWTDAGWTDNDPACYLDPTPTAPLVLVINRDFAPLREYREAQIKQRVAEQRITERLSKYEMHVAFHLYQMYQATVIKERNDESLPDERSKQRLEIHRVAMTLLKLMQVSR